MRASQRTLLAQPRIVTGSKVKKLRQEGWLPAILYGRGFESTNIQVKSSDFKEVYKETGETIPLNLSDGDESKLVLIKDLQRDGESGALLHVDFHLVDVKQKKRISKKPYVITVVAVFFLASIFIVNQNLPHAPVRSEVKKQVLSVKDKKEKPGSPVRLKIPAINVDTSIEEVGLTEKGEMEVPTNSIDVGWFNPGPRPGEKGSAVIAGHFDGANGETGVFTNLNKLQEGDKLYVVDDKGASIAFVVRERRTYDPGYADEVFSKNDDAHLNLITCDGVWDGTKKSYSKRLVIFADIVR
jgi:LPXTG-site transpeptidase (sortase) family protein